MNANIFYVDASELDRVSRNLSAYIEVSKKSKDEVLNKKGNDLRINLFRGFFSKRWKQGGKKGGGNLSRTLKRITASGKGILIRMFTLNSKWAPQIPDKDKNGKPLSLHQKLVAQEVLRRMSGIGILGVSFLRKVWRYKKEGRYLTENRTRGFGKAVTFEKREDEFIITGFTPGLERVASKYGILATAIQKTSADIEVYLARKMGPEFLQTLHA